MVLAGTVHDAIARICPILGVSLGRWDDKATWRIHFADEATPAERVAAQTLVDAFDLNASEIAPLLPQDILSRLAAVEQERDALTAKVDALITELRGKNIIQVR